MKNLSILLCILIFTLSACDDHNIATSVNLKIPRLTDIKVDGNAGDWGVKGLPVQLFADYHGRVPDTADLQANIRLGWDDSGLLVLLKVKDDTLYEPENITLMISCQVMLWNCFFVTEEGAGTWYSILSDRV